LQKGAAAENDPVLQEKMAQACTAAAPPIFAAAVGRFVVAVNVLDVVLL